MEIPKIGKTYNCFDDGKIRESRRYEVTVTKIVPFTKIDDETLLEWKIEVEQCYWLYATETDYFIITTDEDNEEEIFVRTKDTGWFGIGGFLNCGRMDVDGSSTKWLNENKI